MVRFPLPSRRLLILASLCAALAALVVLGSAKEVRAAGLSDPDALEVHQGSLTVRTDGAVIENLEIRGTLRIEASNVKVRNVWVYTKNSWTIYVAKGSATFDNIEVGHPSHVGERGIGGSNVTVRNADIHHVEDGIKLGSNAFYDNVRVHDLDSLGKGPHADAVQAEGTAKNSVVQNSYLDSTGPLGLGNASVIIKSDLGSQANITFRNNYMNGGNYTIFVKNGGHGVPKDVRFINNRLGPDRRYGLMSRHGSVVWENNTWAETGELIDVDGNVIGGGSPTTTTKPPATTTTTKPPATTTTTKPPKTTTTTKPPATTTTTKPPKTTTTTKPPATTTTTTSPQLTTTTTAPPATTTTTSPQTTTTEQSGVLAPPPPPPSGGAGNDVVIDPVGEAGTDAATASPSPPGGSTNELSVEAFADVDDARQVVAGVVVPRSPDIQVPGWAVAVLAITCGLLVVDGVIMVRRD